MTRFGKAARISAMPVRPLGRRDVFFTPGQGLRTLLLFCVFCGFLTVASLARAQDAQISDAQFRAFVTHLWPDARKAGVSRATFDAAFAGLEADPSVLRVVGKQAEFVKPVWDYVNNAVSESRVSRGLARVGEFDRTLERIEARYGVDRFVVMAVWGMETNYGGFSGKMSTIRSLATLAAARYRGTFFREQLIVALQILEQRHVEPRDMLGSWAGAMGQTQFMPTSFMKYAVDWDGDGHKDIWSSAPDALASTAHYLAEHGWIKGWTWGYEVLLPRGFSLHAHEPGHDRPFDHWGKSGLRRADGQPMPYIGEASLFLPAGRDGPAFLVTRNFRTIKSYNSSSAYALGVALLSDRLAGGAGLRGRWPAHAPTLDVRQSLEIQQRLARLGYPVGDLDGKLGEKAQTAIRHFQKQAGLEPDGYASPQLLERMRKYP